MFKKSWNDAKSVVVRGNMIMLAIGLLLGAAFGALVKSFANDIIMGAITNAVGDKFKDLSDLREGAILYGQFIGYLISFIIVALFIFFGLLIWYLIKNYRASKHPQEVTPAAPTTEELILAELKKLNKK